jgi:hypothetical protein
MQTYNTLFQHELEKIIQREIERLRDALEQQPVDIVDRTPHLRGQITALRSMADLIDEASENADQRNR